MTARKQRTQSERNTATRHAIVSAGIKIIATEGTNALRIAKVAKLAGVTTGAIQHQYGNREALLQAIFTEVLGRFNSLALPVNSDLDLPARFEHLKELIATRGTAKLYGILADIMIGARAEPKLRKLVQKAIKQQIDIFERWWLVLTADSDIPPKRRLEIGYALRGTLYGYAIESYYRDNGVEYFQEMATHMIEMGLRTLLDESQNQGKAPY